MSKNNNNNNNNMSPLEINLLKIRRGNNLEKLCMINRIINNYNSKKHIN